ncbi:peptide-methionine (S)-S-oxide reductase MsrA [Pseudomonas stutzeri]|nr:peptide-methionine (S)-S-oxide reductase MsrA [Stutzerimonas stutzeri]
MARQATRRLPTLLLGAVLSTTLSPTSGAEEAAAIFAGGCFWCLEADFDKVPGVLSTTSGYIGGHLADPSYEQVSAGGTGHVEAVLVRYDPARTSYARLLEAFWPNIDPLTATGQFCDIGAQYRSAIFYADAEQRRQAEASKAALQASGRFDRPVLTEVLPATSFYPAEEYHQDYARKNPLRYRFYRSRCGRDARLAELWGERR